MTAMRSDNDPAAETEAALRDREFGAAERLTFFSDAVVAIALTLLALDLPVPKGPSAQDVLRSLSAGGHSYLAFLISFLVISRYWAGHHATFRYLRRMDTALLTLNTFWLLTLVIMPWLTNTLAGDSSAVEDFSGQALRYALYAAGQVAANTLFALMLRHIRRAGLDDGAMQPEAYREGIGRTFAVGLGFLVSIPVFFVWVWAWILWIVIPMGLGLTLRRIRRTQHRLGTSAR